MNAPMILPTPEEAPRIDFSDVENVLARQGIPIEAARKTLQKIFHDCTNIQLWQFGYQGRSGAVIVRAYGFRKNQMPILPCVVKIASADLIGKEYDNYEKCVQGAIAAVPNVYGNQPHYESGWGAIAYTHLGEQRDEEIKTFGEFYGNADTVTLIAAVERLFDKVMNAWICRRTLDCNIMRWEDVYRLNEPDQFQQAIVGLQNQGFHVVQPNPVKEWTDRIERLSPEGGIPLSCIHGDLNHGNIIIGTSSGQPCLIDFAETGMGHYVRDLAKLESKVKFLLLDSSQNVDSRQRMRAWLALDSALNAMTVEEVRASPSTDPVFGDKELDKAFRVIHKIRSIAFDRMTGAREVRCEQYYVALLYHTLLPLAYNDISDFKRAFACEAAARLCQFRFGNAGGSSTVVTARRKAPEYTMYVAVVGDPATDGVGEQDRYLCLAGCIFSAYRRNEGSPLERFEIQCRNLLKKRSGNRLSKLLAQGPEESDELLHLITESDFKVISVLLNKRSFLVFNPPGAHRGHSYQFLRASLSELLRSYCELLEFHDSAGNVLFGDPGPDTSPALGVAWRDVYDRGGASLRTGAFFQAAITHKNVRHPPTGKFTALQLAELIAEEKISQANMRLQPLQEYEPLRNLRLLTATARKVWRNPYTGKIRGHGEIIIQK